MALIAYTPGSTIALTDRNFLSNYELIKTQVDSTNYLVYGSQRFSGLMELFGAKEAVGDIAFNHYEENRIMPKIKATNGGAGSAGAAVTFDLASAADVNYGDASPYAGTATVKHGPVKVNDVIQIKPASGTTASSGNYIDCIVTAVDMTAGSNGQFTAYPLDSTEAIPSIATADEIIITGNAWGEGSGIPSATSFGQTKRTGYIQTIKQTAESTGIANATIQWFKDERTGSVYGAIKEEGAAYTNFLNYREMQLLVGPGLSSTTVSNVFQTAGTPLSMTKGLIPLILERGNTSSYSSITGYTTADLDSDIVTLDQQKGAKNNLFLVGIQLDLQLDNELADFYKNGSVVYGSYRGTEDKTVSMSFKTIEKGGYIFQKKRLDVFSDLQTFGASGFGYPYEGMIIPADMTTDGNGKKVPPFRLRYMSEEGKKSQEMTVDFVDMRKLENGYDKTQYRYQSKVGLQGIGLNRAIYVKRS